MFCTRLLELDIVIALCYQLNVKDTNGCEDHQLRQADERSVGGSKVRGGGGYTEYIHTVVSTQRLIE